MTEQSYASNFRLNKAEYALRHIYLKSMPRYMTVVIGNHCNLDCLHCYQVKNGDNLLTEQEVSQSLRRELMSFYPYLSTLRIQGGEVFMLRGFKELIDDVETMINRPIISISTNGTLINDKWAERIVRMPFQSITISIDGATDKTFSKIRRGARLHKVLKNIERIQRWKEKLQNDKPSLDCFFVIMRSNFLEIREFLNVIRNYGISKVSFQTLLVDQRNLSREPELAEEVISDPIEIKALYDLFQDIFKQERQYFDRINLSGLSALFAENGLDPTFLNEEESSLYPDNEGVNLNPNVITQEICDSAIQLTDKQETQNLELCPNPWTSMFITENGDVSICFLSAPIGNLYESPLVHLWNAPNALAMRSHILAGRHKLAGCSKLWCSWREGKACSKLNETNANRLMAEFKKMINQALSNKLSPEEIKIPSSMNAVRRLLTAREQRIVELETNLVDLCNKNQSMLDAVDQQRQILERDLALKNQKITELEFNLNQLHDKFKLLETHEQNNLKNKFRRFSQNVWIRLAEVSSKILSKGKTVKNKLFQK